LKEQDEADKLEVFHQVLLSKGLVKEMKNPPVTRTIKRQLIEVKGKPVSQTIIEERK
jgi:dTDP-glucose pyrophosphorylase